MAPGPPDAPRLRIEAGAPLFEQVFTLSLWVQPASHGASELVAEPGSLALGIDAKGRVTVSLEVGEETFRLRSREPLRIGSWNHVALAVDALRFRHLRLVVNDAHSWRLLPEGEIGRGSGGLTVGGWSGGGGGFDGAIDQLGVEPRALPTGELLARSQTAAAPGEHVLSLRYRSESRQERLWAFPLRQPSLETPDDWRRGALEQVVAEEDELRWAPARWERATPLLAPEPRTTHATVFVDDHRALLFGGEVRDSHSPPWENGGDTWLYDLVARRWSRVETPLAPPPRCHQDAAYSPDHDLVLMVGGWQNGSPGKPLLSDVCVYHVAEGRWEERPPSDFQLPAMADSGVVYHAAARRFLVFRQHEVYEYDPEADRWSQRPAPDAVDERGRPVRLAGRVSPIMGYDPESGLVVRFGGALVVDGEQIYTNTTALYDHGQNRWTMLRPALAPAPRVRAGFAHDPRRGVFVLFGGVQDQNSKRYDDLWTFDVADRRWRQLAASNGPSARGGYYGMAYDDELDEFVLAAGRHSKIVMLDETWHLRIDPQGEGTATYVFDRSGFAASDRWFATFVEPPGSRVAFRFWGSDDAVVWGDPVAEPRLLVPQAPRYVKVRVELTPGADGKAPRVVSMGFRRVQDDGAAGGTLELPVDPYEGRGST